MTFRNVAVVLLMAVAYLLIFILGATSGIIHPACYAYIGALLPLLMALLYLNTCTVIRGFGAATVLNGILAVLFLIAGEADVAFLIGMAFLLLIDELTPHLHVGAPKAEGLRSRLSRTAMLALAVTIHNLPEGAWSSPASRTD